MSEPVKIVAAYIKARTQVNEALRAELSETRDAKARRRIRLELKSSEANLNSLLEVFKCR